MSIGHLSFATRNWTLTIGLSVGLLVGGVVRGQPRDRWSGLRKGMTRYVQQQGVKDRRVLAALAATPRHLFVPVSERQNAYYDMALPIGSGQTISPPFVVAYMTEQLRPQREDKVLEIGTGSGYQAAILSPLVDKVYSIEIVEALSKTAAKRLKRLGYENVKTKIGDGFRGWAEHAPFDKIIVTCSPEEIPPPLVDQLREGGRLVIPLGERFQQLLYLYKKVDGELREVPLQPTFFVPMTGKAEELRDVKTDTGRPDLRNGGFEKIVFEDQPSGWYGVRLAKITTDRAAPEGKRCLLLENDIPGRWAQALQAVGVDGRRVRELEVSLWVRGEDVRLNRLRAASQEAEADASHVQLHFFDRDRAPAGTKRLGLWTGRFDWVQKTARLKVPPSARLAVVALSLSGGTGELSIDGLQITVRSERGSESSAERAGQGSRR